jgi:hypothetical protein
MVKKLKPDFHVAGSRDRYALKEGETYDPWYVGTEMSYNDQREMFNTKSGPHPGSLYYTSDGGTTNGP